MEKLQLTLDSFQKEAERRYKRGYVANERMERAISDLQYETFMGCVNLMLPLIDDFGVNLLERIGASFKVCALPEMGNKAIGWQLIGTDVKYTSSQLLDLYKVSNDMPRIIDKKEYAINALKIMFVIINEELNNEEEWLSASMVYERLKQIDSKVSIIIEDVQEILENALITGLLIRKSSTNSTWPPKYRLSKPVISKDYFKEEEK